MDEEIFVKISYSIMASKEEAIKKALEFIPCEASSWRELTEDKNKRQVSGVVMCEASYFAIHPCGAQRYDDTVYIEWEPPDVS